MNNANTTTTMISSTDGYEVVHLLATPEDVANLGAECLSTSVRKVADSLIEGAAVNGITVSDESREDLIAWLEDAEAEAEAED